jgi:hypothetical protein
MRLLSETGLLHLKIAKQQRNIFASPENCKAASAAAKLLCFTKIAEKRAQRSGRIPFPDRLSLLTLP